MEVPVEIYQKYFERRKHDLDECLNSLAEKNFAELEKIGHQMKGSAATFGHPELSELGKKLEQAAFYRDLGQLDEVIKDFSSWLKIHVS